MKINVKNLVAQVEKERTKFGVKTKDFVEKYIGVENYDEILKNGELTIKDYKKFARIIDMSLALNV